MTEGQLEAPALNADANSINDCLGYIKPDTVNSPEVFLGMCGILVHVEDK